MSAPDPTHEALRWLRYALEDFQAAEASLGHPRLVPRHTCWLAQQAAEKALKAGLVALQIEFPRWHDLDALRNLLPEDWLVKAACPDLGELTEWAVEARYPGDWEEATTEHALRAVEQARLVVTVIQRDLAALGIRSA